ncbi:MAG: KEOPS complex subunit Pcc1 [Halobacteriota archaeon]
MRRARIRTRHDDAAAVAAALVPDNTQSMTTTVDGDYVETTIERDSTGGLEATVDDYAVNLTVADTVIRTANTHDT